VTPGADDATTRAAHAGDSQVALSTRERHNSAVAELPRRRVVMLGASNLFGGIHTAVAAAEAAWGKPLDLLAAHGFGRGYAADSWVLGRELPAIFTCGLWRDLSARPALPTAALITDVGNDLLYGVPAGKVAQSVETCLARLLEVAERVAVTQLPLASISRLDSRRFVLLRTIQFPRSRLTYADAMAQSEELNDRLIELAGRYGAEVVDPPRDWYGIDSIHIRWRMRRRAWGRLLAPWHGGNPLDSPSGGPGRLVYLQSRRPEWRRLFGIEQRGRQPTATLPGGTRVSFY
jgi:hypothetical protein